MRSAKNIKLSCKSLKEKDDVILNRMPMRQNSISRRLFVICQVPAVRNEIHNFILLDNWLLGHWLPLYKHHAPKWKGRRRKIEIYMLTSYQVPPLDAKATCKWNEQKEKEQAPERERKRMTDTHVQTHVGSNRRRTVLHSRKQGRAFSWILSFVIVDSLTQIRI